VLIRSIRLDKVESGGNDFIWDAVNGPGIRRVNVERLGGLVFFIGEMFRIIPRR